MFYPDLKYSLQYYTNGLDISIVGMRYDCTTMQGFHISHRVASEMEYQN